MLLSWVFPDVSNDRTSFNGLSSPRRTDAQCRQPISFDQTFRNNFNCRQNNWRNEPGSVILTGGTVGRWDSRNITDMEGAPG
jgi:hypothetical protein